EQEKRMNDCPLRTSNEAFEILSRAGEDLEARKPFGGVEADLRRAVSLDPKSVAALEMLAHVLMLQQRFKEATDFLEQAIHLRPDYALPHLTLGQIHASKDLYMLARNELQEAIRLDPDRADARITLGDIFCDQRKWPDAISTLTSAG